MKRTFLTICLMALTSFYAIGQGYDLTVSRRDYREQKQMGGLGRAVFIATTADLMIKTSDEEYECSRAVADGDKYRYTIDIDVSAGNKRVFIVTKAGTPLVGKSSQFMFNKDEICYFDISQPTTILGKAVETISSKSYFLPGIHPTEALIEINSGIKLEVNYSEFLHATHKTALRNGTYIDSLIFDVPRLAALQHLADSLQGVYEKLSASATSEWTDKQWDNLEKLRLKAEKAAEISGKAAIVTIRGNGTNTLTINEELIRRLTPKDKLTYGILVGGNSFDDLLVTARKYYNEYPSHTESSYYDAAKIAYDAAINHNDCPYVTRDSLRAEYDVVADIRKKSYLIEIADKKAIDAERQYGFESKEVFRYLGAQVHFIDSIMHKYPEIKGFQMLKDEALSRLGKHPLSKVNNGTEDVTRSREILKGSVSFKHESMAIPFNEMSIYATKSPKIKGSNNVRIGWVKADGTFSVVKPDGFDPLYIYVSGEKGKAHFVPKGTTTIDIIVD